MARTIIVGDVHGCIDELRELVEVLAFQPGSDRFISCGDIVDRGPDSAGCIRYLMSIGAEAVMGNHDDKLLRRWKHIDKARLDPKYKNPMKRHEDQERTIAALGPAERSWLADRPYIIHLPEFKAVITHAGLVPGKPLEFQTAEAMMMVRYVQNGTNKMLSMIMPGYLQPQNSYYWAENWQEDYDVIFGHNVLGPDVKVWQNGADKGRCWGIDTGCVFGLNLTALVIDEPEAPYQIVQVPARRAYNELKLQGGAE